MIRTVKMFAVTALVLAAAHHAHALDCVAPLTCAGDSISLDGILGLDHGGSAKDLSAVATGSLIYKDADSFEGLPPDSTAGKCVKSNGTGNAPVYGDCPTSDTNTRSPISFGTMFQLTAGVATYYIWPGAIDTTEDNVAAPMRVAMTLRDLSCRASAVQGASNDVVVTVRTGSCGTTALSLSDSTVVCTLAGHAANKVTCDSGANTIAVTADQCVSVKVTTPAALTNPVWVNCTMTPV